MSNDITDGYWLTKQTVMAMVIANDDPMISGFVNHIAAGNQTWKGKINRLKNIHGLSSFSTSHVDLL